MDGSLVSTRSVEMSPAAVSPRMVTAWVAGIRVITLLAMPLSLSHFPGEAKSKMGGGTSVRRGGGVRWWHALSMVRDSSSTAWVRQFAPPTVAMKLTLNPHMQNRHVRQPTSFPRIASAPPAAKKTASSICSLPCCVARDWKCRNFVEEEDGDNWKFEGSE